MPTVSALEAVTLSIEKISADNWSLEDAQLVLFDFNKQSPQFSLVSAVLTLPAPFEHITLAGIHCKQFHWRANYLNCARGRAHLTLKNSQPLDFDFALKVENQQTSMIIQSVSLFDGEIDLYLDETTDQWQLKIQAKNLKLEQLKALFAEPALTALQGHADIDIELHGDRVDIIKVQASVLLTGLSMESVHSKLLGEKLSFKQHFSAHKKGSEWLWETANELLAGDLYIEPVYLDVGKAPLRLNAHGLWLAGQKMIYIDSVQLAHFKTSVLEGTALLNYQAEFMVENAEFSARLPELQVAAPLYLKPFLETGVFEGISLAGSAEASLIVAHNNISLASISFKHLKLDDTQQQFYLNDAFADIHWAAQADNSPGSYINWRQLRVKGIPFAAGKLDFMLYGKQLELLGKADLPVLGGVLSINQFSFAAVKNDDAQVYFQGSVKQLSLAQLSAALGWTPLSGEISGYIPSVNYQNKKLSLGGALNIQVFDGDITIKKLASSGMFSDFPQIYTDIEIDNLDLHALTRKFQFGNIEGRLSGFAREVYLENWQPVSFYAWLGTPDDDAGRHKISQKAVENIASIGGGGAADVLSRGFLGLFDHFGYAQLGVGCYLHQGVCQIMSLEAIDNGFYLIKGEGLPQINVIGYNPRVDWGVLLKRLNRITASDELVIE